MNILNFSNFYLVGIKGVGMATMAELLSDAGKNVSGCDLAEDHVTKPTLDRIGARIDTGFEQPLPEGTDCVIYTAAHQGNENPMVKLALNGGLTAVSHAEALGSLFNQKKGIAVCGVGGKSSTSAMLAWIFEKTQRDISYAVGVAKINGLEQTGKWSDTSEYFIAEADEYAANPSAVKNGAEIVPRFSYLNPFITVSKQIVWDHPDVYRDFNHTLEVFSKFFSQIDSQGTLILPSEERSKSIKTTAQDIWDYGNSDSAMFLAEYERANSIDGKTIGTLQDPKAQIKHRVELQVPGRFNFDNAVSAIIAAYAAGVPMDESIAALKSFTSTKRRFEKVNTLDGIVYYDDYAHHPLEVKASIEALNDWYPDKRKLVIFQPHTFSRTRELFDEFVASLATAEELVLTDIFASAREAADPNTSSQQLVDAIKALNPDAKIHFAPSVADAAEFCKKSLMSGDICLTLGAGDIYKLHNMLY